jgi:spore coat polysaccharide biosynthesis protein SpsF
MTQDLGRRRVIDWVLTRVPAATLADLTILALPEGQPNDALAAIAADHGIPVVRGPEDDVLARFVKAHAAHPADHVVRVCADNPFVSPEEIDRLVAAHLATGADYTFNHIPALENGYPDGLGAEIVTERTLRRLDAEASLSAQREHVTAYVWDHQDQFSIRAIPAPPELVGPDLKLDIDTPQDLERLRRLPCLNDVGATAAEIVRAYRRVYG